MQNASARPIFRKNTFVVFSNQISSHERATTFCQRIIKSAMVICMYVIVVAQPTILFFFFLEKSKRIERDQKNPYL